MNKKIITSVTALMLATSSLPAFAHAKEKEAEPTVSSAPAVKQTMNLNQPKAGTGIPGVNFNVNLDVLGIANSIRDAVVQNANRPGFVKNMMESTFYSAGQKYNVMVFNLAQNYDDHFRGVKFYGSAVLNGVVYGIWVFEDGEFTNQGDGGWDNWAFRGWFDRDGKYVKFYRP
ncbi:stress response protein YvgO [Bacillus velezensis]|uniref:stress response protein YvgO n=2 Tax=Bacillaceae TaxID=186817 RepID=UPI0006A802DD|nr:MULTISPECIES: stress response protein YvgO [Bacillus]MCA1234175.1 stress response protein YvgO [Bacillus velezensis]MCA1312232.1 stress response protein YvgO [Bacillus velezensis]MCA1331254.1 stress response protein YvgO [Bacillus velezensis]MCM3278692.1 stress response protein YvgO [Bacillus velezensis]MCM3351822.1 stress response protein YvgO [Bacillus velezensis]